MRGALVWKSIGILALVISLSGCLGDLCGNEIVSDTPEQAGRVRAIVFVRDCGATTGFSTQVSILDEKQSVPNEPGNTFVAHDRLSVSVRWTAPDRLVVTYPAQAKVFLQENQLKAVKVSYEQTH